MNSDTDRNKRLVWSFATVVVLAPVVMGAIATLLQVRILPEVPALVAIHFSGTGPDGYGPAWAYPALTLGLVLGFVLLAAVPVLVSTARSPEGRTPVSPRLVSALIWATTAFFCVVLTASLYLHRGVDDPSAISGLGRWIGIGAATAVVAAALGAATAPKAGPVHASDRGRSSLNK